MQIELIIERGCHYLQTIQGEKLPRVVETLIRQKLAEPPQCDFTMFVNEPFGCKYDERKNRISTPGGLLLTRVEVLKHKPSEGELHPAMVLCRTRVALAHNTNHKPHFATAQN